MTTVYLGKPTSHVEQFIKDHETPPAIPTVTHMKDSNGNIVTEWPLDGYVDFCGSNLPQHINGHSIEVTYMIGTTPYTTNIMPWVENIETGGTYFRIQGLAIGISDEIGTDRTCTFTMTVNGQTGIFTTRLAQTS